MPVGATPLGQHRPSSAADRTLSSVVAALRRIRNFQVGLLEEKLVDMMCEALDAAHIPYEREKIVAKGCRIDLVVPIEASDAYVGIEVKRGRPRASSVTAQVARYAATGKFEALVFVAERTFDLPTELQGVPITAISLDAAFGISL